MVGRAPAVGVWPRFAFYFSRNRGKTRVDRCDLRIKISAYAVGAASDQRMTTWSDRACGVGLDPLLRAFAAGSN